MSRNDEPQPLQTGIEGMAQQGGIDETAGEGPQEAGSSEAAGDVAAKEAELTCGDCGRPNPVWFAPNKVWNFVIGGPEAKGDPGGIYCPGCFIIRAEKAGVKPTAWELRPETNIEQPTAAGEGVTQADRDAAADLAEGWLQGIANIGGNDIAAIRNGFWDKDTDDLGPLVQAFAKHRLAALARLSRPDSGGGRDHE